MSFEPGSLLPFPREELAGRESRLRAALRARGVDAMLVFAQESHYWLTGYDTGGFVFFQCAIVPADDRPIVLLTRRPDLVQARLTSTMEDIRIWWDADDADPAVDLRAILEELGLKGGRVAIELNTHGLTGWNLWRTQRALDGFCTLESDDQLIRTLRLVKSPAELAYVRKAADILDQSLTDVIAAAKPGMLEQEVKGVYYASMLRHGADAPPNGPLFNSGERATFGRSVAGPRRIEPQDQLLVEYPVSFRRYNVKTEWTIVFGTLSDTQRKMYDAARQTLHRMTEIARPGTTLGEIFDAHADGLDSAGYAAHRYGATGYSVGIGYPPTSMDVPPMIYAGAKQPCVPGMTLFYHVMIGDSDTGYGMGVGHTLLVTEGAPEVLTALPDDITIVT